MERAKRGLSTTLEGAHVACYIHTYVPAHALASLSLPLALRSRVEGVCARERLSKMLGLGMERPKLVGQPRCLHTLGPNLWRNASSPAAQSARSDRAMVGYCVCGMHPAGRSRMVSFFAASVVKACI